MKRIGLLALTFILSHAILAQGNSGNSKGKNKSSGTTIDSRGKKNDNNGHQEDKVRNDEYDRKVWEGIGDGNSSCMKLSKNQPAKVRSAFQRDYPIASFVRWTKCRGDWTASFNNGIFRSTAVYHANGDRRDTRSFVQRENIPVRILDIILKRMPGTNVDGAIKIEVPNIVKDIFRIKNMVQGGSPYLYLDADGAEVQYNY